MTEQEKQLLHHLESVTEVIDAPVQGSCGTKVYFTIEAGIPIEWEARPVGTGLNGIRKSYGPPRKVHSYDTDIDKIYFLRMIGRYSKDPLFQEYSNQFKDRPIIDLELLKPESTPAPTTEQEDQPEEVPPPKTDIEVHLLKRLADGELDGAVGLPCDNGWGSMVWYWIEGGVIKRYKQGPTKRFFNGDDNEKIIPDWKPDRILKDENEQLEFLRRSGRHMKDPEVIAYSDKYWSEYWNNKKKSHS